MTGLVGRGGSAVSWVPALHDSSFQREWLSGEHWYLAAAAVRPRRDLSRCAVPTLGVPRQIGREKHVDDPPLLPRRLHVKVQGLPLKQIITKFLQA